MGVWGEFRTSGQVWSPHKNPKEVVETIAETPILQGNTIHRSNFFEEKQQFPYKLSGPVESGLAAKHVGVDQNVLNMGDDHCPQTTKKDDLPHKIGQVTKPPRKMIVAKLDKLPMVETGARKTDYGSTPKHKLLQPSTAPRYEQRLGPVSGLRKPREATASGFSDVERLPIWAWLKGKHFPWPPSCSLG